MMLASQKIDRLVGRDLVPVDMGGLFSSINIGVVVHLGVVKAPIYIVRSAVTSVTAHGESTATAILSFLPETF